MHNQCIRVLVHNAFLGRESWLLYFNCVLEIGCLCPESTINVPPCKPLCSRVFLHVKTKCQRKTYWKNWTNFNRDGSHYLACNEKGASHEQQKHIMWGKVRKFVTSSIIVWIYLFKLYWQVVGIPMCTYLAPLVANFFCYERGFMLSMSYNN